MQGHPKAPAWADGEALPDQNDTGVKTNWLPATVNTNTATFGLAARVSIEFPESLLLERWDGHTEEGKRWSTDHDGKSGGDAFCACESSRNWLTRRSQLAASPSHSQNGGSHRSGAYKAP
jgi:hypothetical protein